MLFRSASQQQQDEDEEFEVSRARRTPYNHGRYNNYSDGYDEYANQYGDLPRHGLGYGQPRERHTYGERYDNSPYRDMQDYGNYRSAELDHENSIRTSKTTEEPKPGHQEKGSSRGYKTNSKQPGTKIFVKPIFNISHVF
ncbi:hypothetical protein JTB14_003421 [Gonioctena quinquepunctata]|nr:hypothetical protein JTB14_003421 [Gonioctena quinquepunctata]